MTPSKEKLRRIARPALENAVRFLFNLGVAYAYQFVFGAQNILVGVVIALAITLFPVADLGIRPLPMALITVGLFCLCGPVAQLAMAPPLLALPCNFAFVALIMLTTCEPMNVKPFISFLLCFLFCQATPVSAEGLPMRMLALAAGAAATAAATCIWWRRRGYGANGRTLKEQMRLCLKNRGLILRMSAGIALAMLLGSLLGLKKPLWISIVVFSLTQLDLTQTVQRIKHRLLGTVLGSALFLVVFRLLVPEQYSMALLLLMGYLSFFTPEYKHKQVVNAVNALCASLVLLDTATAIENRFMCLLGGIAIVLALFLIERAARRAEKLLRRRGRQIASPAGEGILPPDLALDEAGD